MERKVVKLKVDNKDKDLVAYLKPQWSWKTLATIGIFSFVIVFVVIHEIHLSVSTTMRTTHVHYITRCRYKRCDISCQVFSIFHRRGWRRFAHSAEFALVHFFNDSKINIERIRVVPFLIKVRAYGTAPFRLHEWGLTYA